MRAWWSLPFLAVLAGLCPAVAQAEPKLPNPYDAQVQSYRALLTDGPEGRRAWAAEALGHMRATAAEDDLRAALRHASPAVRKEAALALAWCGSRKSVPALLAALDDADWLVRQTAHASLVNITGMELDFDALAAANARAVQADKWRQYVAGLTEGRAPAQLLALLGQAGGAAGAAVTSLNLAEGCQARVSSAYRGGGEALTDGDPDTFWQTKEVAFPQSCTLDLGKVRAVGQIVIVQYGAGFEMTDFEIALSQDGKDFQSLGRKKGPTPVRLAVTLPPQPVRHVRITSYATVRAVYPTTFREVEVYEKPQAVPAPVADGAVPVPSGERAAAERLRDLTQERAMRALGSMGGQGAVEAIVAGLGNPRRWAGRMTQERKSVARCGLRSLGRLGGPLAYETLVAFLDNPDYARNAAEALGDLGDARAVTELISRYPKVARNATEAEPPFRPLDDRENFPSKDRMPETAFHFLLALSRLAGDDEVTRAGLRKISPQMAANIPQDYDGMVLYELESTHRLTRYLMEKAGTRQEAVEAAFEALGQKRRFPPPADIEPMPSKFKPNPKELYYELARVAVWLPTLIADAADLPRLQALLEHPNRWVQLNAAKAVAYLGDRGGVAPLARLLETTPPEAHFGFSPKFIDEEYNDPAPRVREALVRGLGLLNSKAHAGLIGSTLADERSVLEVRMAAVQTLSELDCPEAVEALRRAAESNGYYTVRMYARDALRQRGLDAPPPALASAMPGTPLPAPAGAGGRAFPDAIVFIRGENALPNYFQNDCWRQAYVTTDTGPTYRPGRNIFKLSPVRQDGTLTPLTTFRDGYVADLEVSYDARKLIFCRREQNDPWWHIFEMNADGTGLRQLTHGPYHDINPVYLPDGRILFASSRLGTRDEYHGYYCTGMHVMNADGGEIHPIATNAGRDNEPAVMADGRIVFARLEVFYSRLKTEITIHTCQLDGTQDMVIYGPERREFWVRLNVGQRGGDYEAQTPMTHRVLRASQPQDLGGGRILCASQGGLVIIGPGREEERIIPHDFTRAFTTPYPLGEGRILCASTLKCKLPKDVDLGLCLVDPRTGERTEVYNDPAWAEYEARPLQPRAVPPLQPAHHDRRSYSGTFVCSTVRDSREPVVPLTGRLVRVIEGVPVTGRHATQKTPSEVWRNHGGTMTRVLGTFPVAADGSFHVEVPADRLVHFQVLDADKRVVGNQLTWIYVRPGETRSCVGCHEPTDHTSILRQSPRALQAPPVPCLPGPDNFRYRAKMWHKGVLIPEAEIRTRSVRSINLIARE